jgi:RNA polymerase sigma factor (sigma-70 family)
MKGSGMAKRTNVEWVSALASKNPRMEQELWDIVFRFGTLAARHYGQTDDLGYEAAAEGYLEIINTGIHQFKNQGPFEGYCRIIVLNKLRDRLPRAQDPQPLSGDTPAPKLGPDPEDILGKLRPCLGELSSLEQRVIDLIHLYEHDPETVARQLNITRNYVNVTAFRARKKLKDCLNRQGYTTSADLL